MEKTVENFKLFWCRRYQYISLELTDNQIQDFLDKSPTVEIACDRASDYLLANGLAEVME